ncbi:MAG TPA: hypothetical protein VHU90_02595 [Galbitalea sp.]|jgi:hypothetical protein|nr:hypothetical protein [Galbitalea sp.]
MRKDMAKVVTERPRRGHANPSAKWGRRLAKDEYALDDHGASRAPVSRHRQYGWNAKEFSDSLGPLRGYLRKQIGRPWDKVWSEIATTLDSRSLTGRHIFDHIRWEVELDAWLGDDGRLYHKRWGTIEMLAGLYVHPVTGLLARKPERRWAFGFAAFQRAHAALRTFGITASNAQDVRRFRIDGLRVWECRGSGWYIHSYRRVPEQLVRVMTRSDGREVPIFGPAHLERTATKQASKKEIRDAQPLLRRDPLTSNEARTQAKYGGR